MRPAARVVALATYELACSYNDGIACDGRRTEYEIHRWLAVAGLAVALGMAWATFRAQRRTAVALAIIGFVLFAASFLFADAGVHGWEDLKVYPQL